ncbi:MAG TPA: hypothetical protein VNE21_08795, partial [Mycobacteriales bacterium]|nr:hypothetical protein [Mycobacteriales bacterium]
SQGMNAALKTAGLKFFDIERISRINSTSDEGTVVQQANSAVLRFHSEGVDRILFLTTYGGLLDAIFMKDASQQHYYPEYGLSSHDAPVALGGGNVPADQLANAQGLGWAPFTDFATVPADQTAPSEPKCLHILESAGVPAPTDRGQVNQDLLYCSSFLLFAKIATAAGPDLTRRSFIRAGEALGDAYDDPLAIRGASEIGPGSHQGITDGELIRYVPSCTCFEPAGPVVRIR